MRELATTADLTAFWQAHDACVAGGLPATAMEHGDRITVMLTCPRCDVEIAGGFCRQDAPEWYRAAQQTDVPATAH